MIAIGSDHGGYKLKEEIKKYLEEKEIEYTDCGTFNEESIDYKWCTLEELLDLIKWYTSKVNLKYALLNNGFDEEKEEYI